jgi:hypothetical protein
MAGVKEKSGLRKGRTNNPGGRPKGVPNKVPETLKKRITVFLEDNFDDYIRTLQQLEPKDRVKAMGELMRLVVPRPVSKEELEAIAGSGSPLVARLFLKGDNPDRT